MKGGACGELAVPEHFTNYPSYPTLADGPIDYRYVIRLYDKSTKLWHEIPDWKIANQTLSPDLNYGWSPSREVGKISAIVGTPDEQVLNRHVFSRLTYHRGDTGAPIPFSGINDITISTEIYNGSTWRDGLGYPLVAQEANRGFIWAHPDTTVPAVIRYTAPIDATYTFTGDFARAHKTWFG